MLSKCFEELINGEVELLNLEPGTTEVPPQTEILCENLVSVHVENKTLDYYRPYN